MIVDHVTTKDAMQALRAVEVLVSRRDQVDAGAVERGIGNWLNEDVSDQVRLEATLGIIDLVAADRPNDEPLGQLATDGTLMHYFWRTANNQWNAAAALASMLYLEVRSSTFTPTVNRDSGAGIDRLREALTNPPGHIGLVAAQGEWLARHESRAVPLLLERLAEDASISPWVKEQLKGLFAARSLRLTAEQFINNRSLLIEALGDSDYEIVLRSELQDVTKLPKILAEIKDPSFALTALMLEGFDELNGKDQIEELARNTVGAATKDEWLSELSGPAGGPLIDLAIASGERQLVNRTPSGLSDALLDHAVMLADGQSVWAPTSAVFSGLVALLDDSARTTLAVQVAVKLEARDQVNSQLFEVYGDFLAGEQLFRTHNDLPLVVERLVNHDNWDGVQWFATIASTYSDTFSSPGSQAFVDNLKRVVGEKCEEFKKDPPGALGALARYLNIEMPTAEQEDSEQEGGDTAPPSGE